MKKVLVIGDSCIDVFEYGNCNRICPEAPVPVLTPTNKIETYGMAHNVYQNLIGLGVECDIVTNEKKPVKIRYIDKPSNHMIIRVDRDDYIEPLSWDTLKFDINFNDYDAIVISDYNKGFLSREQIEYIAEITRPSPRITFMDTKKEMDRWCDSINYIKVNEKECLQNRYYLLEYYRGTLIVTQGKDGAILNHEEQFSIENKHPVRDLTGAGDTFLAGLVANFIETKDIREAIKFANKCAAWAVTQTGIATVDLNKIKL